MAEATPLRSPAVRRVPTAERIVTAAIAAFGTRGYGATSLDDLARELGIRKQTILYWYPSKEALLDAAVDRTAAEVAARLRRALVAGGGVEGVGGLGGGADVGAVGPPGGGFAGPARGRPRPRRRRALRLTADDRGG